MGGPELFVTLYALPTLVLAVIFVVIPVMGTVCLSFADSATLDMNFGDGFMFLSGCGCVFRSGSFLRTLFGALGLVLMVPTIAVFLDLMFTFVLARKRLGRGSFCQAMFFFPDVISVAMINVI